MLSTIRPVASLLLSYGLLLLANGMFGTLLGLRSKMEGFATETIGVVMAGFFIGMLLGAFRAVRVVAAVGHIRAFTAFASIMSVAVLAHVLWIDPVIWFFLRMVAGFCLAGMVMITESWLNERATNQTRGQVLSLYMMTNYLGSGVGQLMLTVADPARLLPIDVPQLIIQGADDQIVPADRAAAYAELVDAPDSLEVLVFDGAGHFEVIDAAHESWAAVLARLP